MYLLSLLFKRHERSLDQLAQEIARRCRSEVQQHLSVAVNAMSPNELRGYVRSRAAMLIRRESSAALLRRRNLSQSDQAKLVQLATDYVVPLVMLHLSKPTRRSVARKAG